MVVATSLQFLASTWIFTRALVKVNYRSLYTHTYSYNTSSLQQVAIGLYEDSAHKGSVDLAAIGLDEDKITNMENLPTAVEIKSNIPSSCFNSSVMTSFYYAIKDVVLILITYFVAHQLMAVSHRNYDVCIVFCCYIIRFT